MVNTVDATPVINGSSLKRKDDAFKSILQSQKGLEVQDIVNAVKNALVDLTELQITTWVPESSSQNGDESSNWVETAKPGNRIHTVINLIDGDITNEIGSQFVGNGPYVELREFHLTQVQESREIIQKNIESVEKLYKLLMELYKSSKSSQQSPNRLV